MTMDNDQLLKFIDKRIPGRQQIIDLQALSVLHNDPSLMKLADNLADIRQALRGGTRQQGNRHWPADWD